MGLYDNAGLITSQYIPTYQGAPLEALAGTQENLAGIHYRNLAGIDSIDQALNLMSGKIAPGDRAEFAEIASGLRQQIHSLAEESLFKPGATSKIRNLAKQFAGSPELLTMQQTYANWQKEMEMYETARQKGESVLFMNPEAGSRDQFGNLRPYVSVAETMRDWNTDAEKMFDDIPETTIHSMYADMPDEVKKRLDIAMTTQDWTGITSKMIQNYMDKGAWDRWKLSNSGIQTIKALGEEGAKAFLLASGLERVGGKTTTKYRGSYTGDDPMNNPNRGYVRIPVNAGGATLKRVPGNMFEKLPGEGDGGFIDRAKRTRDISDEGLTRLGLLEDFNDTKQLHPEVTDRSELYRLMEKRLNKRNEQVKSHQFAVPMEEITDPTQRRNLDSNIKVSLNGRKGVVLGDDGNLDLEFMGGVDIMDDQKLQEELLDPNNGWTLAGQMRYDGNMLPDITDDPFFAEGVVYVNPDGKEMFITHGESSYRDPNIYMNIKKNEIERELFMAPTEVSSADQINSDRLIYREFDMGLNMYALMQYTNTPIGIDMLDSPQLMQDAEVVLDIAAISDTEGNIIGYKGKVGDFKTQVLPTVEDVTERLILEKAEQYKNKFN